MKDRQLLMMAFANAQAAINLTDELPAFKQLYKQDYKSLAKKWQSKNEQVIDKLYVMMDIQGDEKIYFEKCFYECTEAIDIFMNCVKNNELEKFIALLKAFRDGEIK